MFDSFLAELLVLGMCCAVCLRFFFMKKARVDAVAILAPLAFCFALLSVYTWGAEVQLVATLVLSLFVFLTNVRSLFRLSARLYVDHYSVLFITGSAIELAAAAALITLAVLFHPVRYRTADFGVMKSAQSLTGTLSSGYHCRSELFEKSRITGVLYTYEPEPPHEETLNEIRAKENAARKAALAAEAEAAALAREEAQKAADGDADAANADGAAADDGTLPATTDPAPPPATESPAGSDADVSEAPASDGDGASAEAGAVFGAAAASGESLAEVAAKNPVILFMPGATASVVHYEPYFVMLAQKGYRVLTADFYTGIPRLYESGADQRVFRRAYSVLLSLFAKERFDTLQAAAGEIVSRSYAALTMLALAKYGDDVPLFYAVDALNIELLNNLVALYPQNVIGFFAINRVNEYKTGGYGFIEQTDPLLGALFDVERDESFFIPRYVASKTARVVQDTLKLRHPVEIIRAHHDDEGDDAQGEDHDADRT